MQTPIEKQAEIESQLGQFSGSEEHYRWSGLFKFAVLTDGTKFLSEKYGAYWLMDVIASHQHSFKVRREEFQVWNLKKTKGSGCRITCDDGDKNVVASQIVKFTDFPLDTIKLYATWAGNILTIMLPSEY